MADASITVVDDGATPVPGVNRVAVQGREVRRRRQTLRQRAGVGA